MEIKTTITELLFILSISLVIAKKSCGKSGQEEKFKSSLAKEPSICDDIPALDNFDVERWLSTPIRYTYAVTISPYFNCSGMKWQGRSEPYTVTSFWRDEQQMILAGTAFSVRNKLGHFDLIMENGEEYRMVIIDTDYNASTAFALCAGSFSMGRITTTSTNPKNLKFYQLRLRQLEQNGIDVDVITLSGHDDQCNYDVPAKI